MVKAAKFTIPDAVAALNKLSNRDLLEARLQQKENGALVNDARIQQLITAEERILRKRAAAGEWLSGYNPENITFVREPGFAGDADKTIERLRQISNETYIRLEMEKLARRLELSNYEYTAETDKRTGLVELSRSPRIHSEVERDLRT